MKRHSQPGHGADHPTARQTRCIFKGEEAFFDSEKDGYEWLLERMIATKPCLLEDPILGRHIQTKSRAFFARTPQELFRGTPSLASNKNNYIRLGNGWFADVNLDVKAKRVKLVELAVFAGLSDNDCRLEVLG